MDLTIELYEFISVSVIYVDFEIVLICIYSFFVGALLCPNK